MGYKFLALISSLFLIKNMEEDMRFLHVAEHFISQKKLFFQFVQFMVRNLKKKLY